MLVHIEHSEFNYASSVQLLTNYKATIEKLLTLLYKLVSII